MKTIRTLLIVTGAAAALLFGAAVTAQDGKPAERQAQGEHRHGQGERHEHGRDEHRHEGHERHARHGGGCR